MSNLSAGVPHSLFITRKMAWPARQRYRAIIVPTHFCGMVRGPSSQTIIRKAQAQMTNELQLQLRDWEN
jgi:hypothetical protein